jgi:hypothetical protein
MDALLSDIIEFCTAHGLSKWQFGSMALNDRPFVAQLEAGRRVWPETEAKVRAFMVAYTEQKAA